MKRRELLKNSALTIAGIGALPGLSTLLHSCGARELEGYQPSYLSRIQFSTVEALAETILPRTNTPGATDAGVAPYIDLLFASYFEADEGQRLESYLDGFIQSSQKINNQEYYELDQEGRNTFLQEVIQSETDTFFSSFKDLVMWAYFTSEVGMKSMNYQPVPGRYEACIPVDPETELIVGNR